jgi:hypothetical protein
LLLLGLFLTLAVLAVNAAYSARSKAPARRLQELAYLDEVRPLVERSSSDGADLEQVRDGAAKLGRAAVDRRLEQVATDATSVARAVERAAPPRSLGSAHSLRIATAAIRARAASDVRDALNRALGTDPPQAAIDALSNVGADLVAADRTYQVFLRMLPTEHGTTVGAMPASQWVNGDGWSRETITVFVSTLRASAALAPVHDVAILLVTTDPPAVAQDGANEVLPVVKSLRLQAVVADIGNEAERHVTVVATLTVAGAPPQSVRDFVDLVPGQRATVNLGGLRPDLGMATLTVQVGPVAGESAVADNGKAIPILFR